MGGKASRDRGIRFEKEIATDASIAFRTIVKRKLAASRDGGDDLEVGPLSIECKRRQSLAIPEWIRQAEANAGGKIPVVVFRRDNEPAYAVVRWSDLLDMITGFVRWHIAESVPPGGKT